MKAFLGFILMMFYFNLSFAQNKTIKGQFTGKNLDNSFINIINLNQYKATISQEDGRFEIPAKVGDSILISSIQYSEVKFLVKPEFFEDEIEIPLSLKVNELQDVNLYSLGLTGDLAKDAESIETYDFSQTQLGFPAYIEYYTREERRLAGVSGSLIGYLINLMNGNIKMYKNLIVYERTDNRKERLHQLFPERFYHEDLNIPSNLIEDFTYYCIENHPEVIKLTQQKDKLLLTELLPKLAQDYIKLKESEKDKTQKIND
ncbi:hypothetical protein [Psychroflexus sp. MBR-150]|jgi:hypothetical protein